MSAVKCHNTVMEVDSSKRTNEKYVFRSVFIARQQHESYEEKANFFSKILFLWLNPLLSLGNKRALNPDDLPQLSYLFLVNLKCRSCDRSDTIYSTISHQWNVSKESSSVFSFYFMSSPSLVRSMAKSFGFPFMMAAFLKLIHDICQFVGPFMLPKVIDFLEDVDAPKVLACILSES